MTKVKRVARSLALGCAALSAAAALAGCGVFSGDVYADDATGTAIQSGKYSTAKDLLAQSYASHPGNPYQQFNLAYVNEKLGRSDLAAPLYIQAVADGMNTYPDVYLAGERRGASLGELACRHLIGMNRNDLPVACGTYEASAGMAKSAP